MRTKTNDGLNLYYEIHGNPQAKETLVFLNGLTQSAAAWSFMLPHFKQDFRIILLDFIFQGQSDKSGNWRDFNQHARDVKTVLDTIGVTRIHLAGLSYGSLVAQHFAILYPSMLHKLVLMATFAHKTPHYEAIELSWWRALEQGGYRLMLDIMLPNVLSEEYFSHPLIPIDLMKEMRQGLNENSEAILKLMRATKERKDFRQELQQIQIPALIIQGERDTLLPVHLAEEVNKNIRNSQLIIIPRAGHTLNLEHVTEVAGHIRRFLLQVK